MRKELHDVDKKVSLVEENEKVTTSKKSIKEIDIQYEQVRKQLKQIQSKYDILKKMRDMLQKLARGMGYDPVEQQKLESNLIPEYEYLRQKTRQDAGNV